MVLRSMNSIFTRHGRWLFAVITLVIIVSFVGFLTPGFASLFGGGGAGGGGSVGTAFGRKITAADVRQQIERTVTYMELVFGGRINPNQIYDYASGQAFESLCQTEAAKQRGIYVSEREIASFIESLPRFQGTDGQFSLEKFKQFDNDNLRPRGISQEDLADAIRGEMMKQKLAEEIIGGVVVTPGEIMEYFNKAYEKFEVTAAEFKAEKFLKQVKITEKELTAFFDANRKNYHLPAQYKVQTVAFGFGEFTRKAGASIPESSLKNYYEANKKEFEVKKGTKVEIRPFSQVKEKIRERLAAEEARNMAKDLAQNFAVEAYKKISEDEAARIKHFGEIAGKYQRKVTDLGWVAADSTPDKVLGEPALLSEIAKIYIQIPVSNAVVGDKAAYVIMLEEKKDARPAELKDVRRQVIADLQKRQALTLAREQARNAAAAIGKSANRLAALKKFAGVCELKNPEAFIAMNPPYGADGNQIAALALDTPAGAISKVENTADGAMFVLVRKRVLPAAGEFKAAESFVAGRYTRMKQEFTRLNFSRWLQSKCQQYEQRGNQ